jgi:hypothetical protein
VYSIKNVNCMQWSDFQLVMAVLPTLNEIFCQLFRIINTCEEHILKLATINEVGYFYFASIFQTDDGEDFQNNFFTTLFLFVQNSIYSFGSTKTVTNILV